MPILRLALRSLWNRRVTASLTIAAVAVSVALLLGVQMLRHAAKDGFTQTLSGADLLVGARTGPLNLLLYSIFRIGDATANVSWASYRKIASHSDVAWTIPLSLGDTHRGFRVLGTNSDYFTHYRFSGTHSLTFTAGGPLRDIYDAVIGADVARTLHYALGQRITLSHGLGAVSFAEHKDKPFQVVGILARTGTPVDRTVHVTLEGISAMHLDWRSGMQATGRFRISPEAARTRDLTPDSITAFLVGMRSKVMSFTMQRAINEYRAEALTAVIPGVVLEQMWSLVGIADTALMIVAAFVVLAGLLGMLTSILTSLNERRREMAILRSVGAKPRHVFTLLLAEAAALSILGVSIGVALTYLLLFSSRPLLTERFGIYIPIAPPSPTELAMLAAVIAAAVLTGILPATQAYRRTLADGLQIRV
jgi:putative ABC transport system permease protein